MGKITIQFFVSKRSVYYQKSLEEFKKLIDKLSTIPDSAIEVIDVSQHPEKAEEHKIEALPTLIIGEKRFIGIPDSSKIAQILSGDL